MLDPRCVVGVDASMMGCCVVRITRGEPTIWHPELKAFPPEKRVKGIKGGRSLVSRYNRLRDARDFVVRFIREGCAELVVIEAPFVGRSSAGILYELGSMLRCLLLEEMSGKVVEVTPSVVKKLATGKGNGSKVAVASALSSRYRVVFDNDNEADAYALARIAALVSGYVEPTTKAEAEVLAAVKVQLRQEVADAQRTRGA